MIQWLLNLIWGDRAFGATRSSKWGEVQKRHLKNEPLCVVCKTKGKILNPLNVHHVKPFHLDSSLELDDKNLITLCRNHHFLFGHFLNWKSFNQNVREDSSLWWNKIRTRP